MTRAPTLARKTFRIPRAAEFGSIGELAKLVGHAPDQWLEVVIKELVDNALDNCEEHRVAPEIKIDVDTVRCTIAVEDNGSGIEPKAVVALADLSTKVSTRAAYVSPTRGAQGNALQTLIATPYALDPAAPGDVVFESRGRLHRLVVEADPVERIPRVRVERGISPVKNGSRVTVRWPVSASSILAEAKSGSLSAVNDFTWLNPHLELFAIWDGEVMTRCAATDRSWMKWNPSQPESPHWYDLARFRERVAAEIDHAERRGQAMTVRDFVAQFRGPSSTGKRAEVIEAAEASGMSLREFFMQDGGARVPVLLDAMRTRSSPVKPRDLGLIGRSNIEVCVGDADMETFQYRIRAFEHLGLPYVAEIAFAYTPRVTGWSMIAGLNFSPVVGGRPFAQLDALLAEHFVRPDDPVFALIHLTAPRFDFVDKGKSQVALPGSVLGEMCATIEQATAKWTKYVRATIKSQSAAERRRDEMLRRQARAGRMSKKDAAYSVMERAYMEASSGNTLPAKARQVFYPARRMMLPLLGDGRDISDDHFTQVLLPNFMRDHAELTKGWDVVFDDRGSFIEPHTGKVIGIGTLNTREYVERFEDPRATPARLAEAFIRTIGPKGRYGAVVFIEKEGFDHLMQAAGVREGHDVAVMSTKGFSNTAARKLVDVIIGELKLKLFVLHDFDPYGIGIKQTLVTSGRRYTFENEIGFVDLGLRLDDVNRMALDSEVYSFHPSSPEAMRQQLRGNGATEAEIGFLVDGRGVRDIRVSEAGKPHRVELNAMSSGQIVALIEDGFRRHGVTKVMPDTVTLGEAYGALKREQMARPIIEAELRRLSSAPVDIPADLDGKVRTRLAEHPQEPWDAALREIVAGGK
jgi:hypothetical protein